MSFDAFAHGLDKLDGSTHLLEITLCYEPRDFTTPEERMHKVDFNKLEVLRKKGIKDEIFDHVYGLFRSLFAQKPWAHEIVDPLDLLSWKHRHRPLKRAAIVYYEHYRTPTHEHNYLFLWKDVSDLPASRQWYYAAKMDRFTLSVPNSVKQGGGMLSDEQFDHYQIWEPIVRTRRETWIHLQKHVSPVHPALDSIIHGSFNREKLGWYANVFHIGGPKAKDQWERFRGNPLLDLCGHHLGRRGFPVNMPILYVWKGGDQIYCLFLFNDIWYRCHLHTYGLVWEGEHPFVLREDPISEHLREIYKAIKNGKS